MFRVEFSDGFYITRNGGLFIDGFARDVSLEEIKQLCDLLNSAQQQNAVDRAMPDEPAPQAKRPPTDGGVRRFLQVKPRLPKLTQCNKIHSLPEQKF